MQAQVEAARRSETGVLHGRKIIDEIKASGVEFIPCLPDIQAKVGDRRGIPAEDDPRVQGG